MSICRKAEKSLLDHADWTLVESTHLPAVQQLTDAELAETRKRVRDLRNRQRDMGRDVRRAARGKAEARGSNFPGTYARPAQKKQVFSQALRRVNEEHGRREARASREVIVASQQRALASRKSARSHRPANSATASSGPSAITNAKRTTRVHGAKVGSVSQQGKRSQARKDG